MVLWYDQMWRITPPPSVAESVVPLSLQSLSSVLYYILVQLLKAGRILESGKSISTLTTHDQ